MSAEPVTAVPAEPGAGQSPETAYPVRTVAQKIAGWIARLGTVWVEGQVTQVSRRPGMGTVFLTLRDPVADMSLQVTCAARTCDSMTAPLTEGARVVVRARPEFYARRGQLTLAATEIRGVGVGELLARLEHLKRVLAQEGLFAAERKRPLPFLPRRVGLVTGRASAAERDVVENARRRWPAVRLEVRAVAVQGPAAVSQVVAALMELDRLAEVDVIVVARGGGSVEDLLPFSDEGLLRAVAACRTPVVSAIGHEPDSPLLDLVADVRCTTPTDAGKRVVPDVGEELARVQGLAARAVRCLAGRLDRERHAVGALASRPVLADPLRELDRRADLVAGLRDRARRCTRASLQTADTDLVVARARVRSLSPAATLDRGYAVVLTRSGAVVRRPAQVAAGADLDVRLAQGRLHVVVGDPRSGGLS